MKKIAIVFSLVCFACALTFASEVTTEADLEEVVQEAKAETSGIQSQDSIQAQPKEKGRSHNDARYKDIARKSKGRYFNTEQKVIKNYALIIASTPLITFGGWFCGFTGFLFALNRPDHPLHNPTASYGAIPCIISGMGLITAGLAMLLVGAVHLPKSIKESNTDALVKRLQRLDRNLENLVIVSGVFSGVGMASLGIGIGLMCYANAEHEHIDNPSVPWATGVAMTTVGTIFTFGFVPLFASALSIFLINKKQLVSLSPEIAVTHDDKKGIDEGYGVSFGLKVRI